jgi:hypothetical protein
MVSSRRHFLHGALFRVILDFLGFGALYRACVLQRGHITLCREARQGRSVDSVDTKFIESIAYNKPSLSYLKNRSFQYIRTPLALPLAPNREVTTKFINESKHYEPYG